MAGGNSHQRGVERAAQKRRAERVSVAVDKTSSAMGQSSAILKPEPNKELDKTPWYERGLFWGLVSISVAVVLAVIAATWRDLRWLLLLAWSLAITSTWLACREISKAHIRWIVFGGVSLFCGLVLLLLAMKAPSGDLNGIQRDLDQINRRLSELGRPKISDAQLEAIKEVEQFVVGKDEVGLRREFAYPLMQSLNIEMVRDCLIYFKRTGSRSCNYSPYFTGEVLMDKELGRGAVGLYGGAIVYSLNPEHIGILMLPKEYVERKKVLKRFETSTQLPTSIIDAVQELDQATEENTNNLLRVLHDAANENADYFLHYDDFASPSYFHQVDSLWLSSFVQLRPKADKIKNAIRQFLGVK